MLRLAQTVRPEQMEKACALAMEYQVYSYTPFTRLLAKEAENPPLPIRHENVRGSEYYDDLSGDSHVR
jgi:hypothetical protein